MSVTSQHKLAENRPFDREAQYNAKRRAVIRSAAAAFRRRGYHNASMTEIAKSLGLTKAALYYYVKSKEEILFEAHIMVYDKMDELVKAVRGQGDTGLEKLQLLYGEFAHMLTRDGLALLTDIDSLNGENQETVLKRRGKIERAVTRLVEKGMADDSIKKADAKVTVFFLMGALNWLNVWYEAGGRISGDDIAQQFVAQMSVGVANPT
ncbi:MAG: TetR/AcrR family transcriptional regulator [Hyphomonadaceae bacterium]|nr:TetR/AcrR family transcriptional regulator [Hyphomonadaceae bacterium]